MKVQENFQLNLDGDVFENVVFDGHFIEFENTTGTLFEVGQNILVSEVNTSNKFTGRRSLETIKHIMLDEERNLVTLCFENLHNNHLTDRVSLALSKKYLKTVYDMKISLYNLRELTKSDSSEKLIGALQHQLKEYQTVGEKKNYMMKTLKLIQAKTGDVILYLFIENVLEFNN
ncbi:hypothetical protein ACQUY5_20135 [Bacillus cereus]|uniref:hypothetical protein n=1 Tax=Bacillus cereus TaxID=1396 RepID=UPI003D17187C